MKQERGKAPLMLMEQVVMILVFAIAAALCVQAFVTAGLMARTSEKKDRGANIAQTIAEVVKETHGDLEQAGKCLDGQFYNEELILYYDKDWNQISEEEEAWYKASAKVTEKGEYFSQGDVKVTDIRNEQEIFSLDMGWQEVNVDE